MARSSGRTGPGLEDFARTVFDHAPTGFRYRISPTFSLELTKGALQTAVSMPWYVGSGATARSYLLAQEGYLYESPVAYYTAARKWDLAPGYQTYAYPLLTRAAQPGCLNCHASFLKPVAGTQNRFATPPWGEPGIACERCHGPGERHIAAPSKANIVNPAGLAPARRDSICAQCHLPGEVRVFRRNADWATYQPGGRLSDAMTVFVEWRGPPGLRVTGHMEKLAQSACKRASGDKLWCGTCHNPHEVPSAAKIRTQCLTCHKPADCPSKQQDCLGCHMPKSEVVDAQHVVYTDHSIPRRPRPAVKPVARKDAQLAPFGGAPTTPRDLALAYAIAGSARALSGLQEAARRSPDDTEVLLYLAERYRNEGKPDLAIPLFERAGSELTALVGLGAIRFDRGEYAGAIRLWEAALAKNAGLVLVRTNLAMAYWKTGNLPAAEKHLAKAVALSPGLAAPAELLEKLRGQRKR